MTDERDRDSSEQCLIGAVLMRPALIGEFSSQLDPDDFLMPIHKACWRAMLDIWTKNEPMDAPVIADRVRQLGYGEILKAAGGADYIQLTVQHCVTFENLAYHVRRIKNAGQRYRWGQYLAKMAQRASHGEEGDKEFLESIGAELFHMMLQEGDRSKAGAKEKTRKEVMREVTKSLDEAYENRDKGVIGVPTGFKELDERSRGFRAGQFIVLAARPGLGKSAFMGQVVDYAASQGVAVLVFSLEMTAVELGKRSIAAEGVSGLKMQNGKLNQSDWMTVMRAQEKLAAHDVTTVDVGASQLLEMRSIAKRWRMARGQTKGLVAVDYLQLARAVSKDGNREQQVAEISRTLKELAKELGVPVLALAQLNRKLEDRTNKKPGLGDLRESGQIEQDADMVIFIHRDDVYDDKSKTGEADIIVAKARSMSTFAFKMGWQPEFTRFVNLTDR